MGNESNTETKPNTEPETNSQADPPEENAADEKMKVYESALRKILGIDDSDALDDVEAKIADYQNKTNAALKRADERLISAAISNLSGYDTKLLSKIIDMDKISIDENGEVVGVAEAAAAAAKEFPAVVVKADEGTSKKPFHPISSDGEDVVTGKTMNDYIRAAAGRK